MPETPDGPSNLFRRLIDQLWANPPQPLAPPLSLPPRRPMPTGVNLLARAAAGGFWSGPIPADHATNGHAEPTEVNRP